MKTKEKINVTIDASLIAFVRRVSEDTGKPVSQIMNDAVELFRMKAMDARVRRACETLRAVNNREIKDLEEDFKGWN